MADGERYFPPPLLDPQRAARYASFLKALNEQPLPRTSAPLTARLLCLPTWGEACFICVEDGGIRWHCRVGELDGDAGYEVGKLVRRECFEITSAQSAQLDRMWRHLLFWKLPETVEAEDDLLDGTEYVLEALQDDRHGVIRRSEWEWGDTFGEFVDLLFEVSGLPGR